MLPSMEDGSDVPITQDLARRSSSSASLMNTERDLTARRECMSPEWPAISQGDAAQRYDLTALTKEQLLVLMCFSNAIMSQSLPVKCILMTLKALKANLCAEHVEICYPDRETAEWVIHSVGKDGVLHKKNIPSASEGAYSHAFANATFVRIDHCAVHPLYESQFDNHADVELHNLLICPLLDSKKAVWGVAGIANCPAPANCTFNHRLHLGTSTPLSETYETQQNSESTYIPSCASSTMSSAATSISVQNSVSTHDGNMCIDPIMEHCEGSEGCVKELDMEPIDRGEEGGVWDDRTVTFALQICDIGGQCISNAIGWRQLDATREKADGLLTLMHSLFADRLGIQSCVVALTTHARKLIQAERCTVYIVDRTHEQLWSISSDDGSQVVVPLRQGCASRCVNSGEVIVIENTCEDERFEPEFDSRTGVEIRNVAWVPIKSGDCNRVLAVIEVINKQAEELLHFGEDDLRLLEIFSAIVGPQLEKSDFAVSVSRPAETEAGLAFKTVPQAISSAARQHIPEPCIPETEEEGDADKCR